MYVGLFNLASLAMLGWLLLMLAPTLALTRWLARTAVFPVYLALLYLVGLVPLLLDAGPGIIADFGTADGVVGLLAQPEVTLVAWIHILVFDHLLGILIYRDNMHLRVVPLPVQSLVLFLTLMFGPVGFLLYYGVRVARGHGPSIGAPSAGAAQETAA